MADVAELVERPELRCFGPGRNRHELVCGAPAVWQRRSAHQLEHAFFCDLHRQPGDVSISADAVFRRVTLDVEVRLAATSLLEASARIEAVARLEAAVRAAGGAVSIARVSTKAGRLAGKAGAGRGEAV